MAIASVRGRAVAHSSAGSAFFPAPREGSPHPSACSSSAFTPAPSIGLPDPYAAYETPVKSCAAVGKCIESAPMRFRMDTPRHSLDLQCDDDSALALLARLQEQGDGTPVSNTRSWDRSRSSRFASHDQASIEPRRQSAPPGTCSELAQEKAAAWRNQSSYGAHLDGLPALESVLRREAASGRGQVENHLAKADRAREHADELTKQLGQVREAQQLAERRAAELEEEIERTRMGEHLQKAAAHMSRKEAKVAEEVLMAYLERNGAAEQQRGGSSVWANLMDLLSGNVGLEDISTFTCCSRTSR